MTTQLGQALGLLLTTAAEEGLTDEGFHPETRRLWAEYSELLRRALSGPPSGQESPGGAAPDFPKAQEALRLLVSLWDQYPPVQNVRADDFPAIQSVRATLDQAESEIARLREKVTTMTQEANELRYREGA